MTRDAEARRERALEVLRGVADPELPSADVVGLGIVRGVEVGERPEDGVTVVLTPTFSGCPALRAIEEDVVAALERAGFAPARVRTELSPPWTTEAIDARTRERLRASGIAPPPCLAEAETPARCPRCGAASTLRSRFGSTPCKALWTCPECREPFEAMKAI